MSADDAPGPDHARTARPTGAAALPLLERVTRQALEEDYAHVAARRRAREAADPDRADGAGGAGDEAGRGLRRAAVVAAVFGLLVATAAVQTSRNAATDETSRTTLVGRVNEGRDRVTELQRRVAELRETTDDLSGDLEDVVAAEGAAVGEVEGLRLLTGYGATAGPGVRITVDDSRSGRAEGRVRTSDLRRLVTGLWEAGAEAIAVNGLRLTARTAIVTSGQAIAINTRSLTAPYVVEAIGDTRTLQVDLDRTAYGQAFFTVADLVGLQVEADNVARLQLPAPADPVLRYAEPSTPTTSPEASP
ncbi:DUF881 domain-containing protein [Nocardioides zeae]|uniref:DUF881 domain-containing protein n=1 Tax=Nocardioides imazamoxiresistens TaxID=3231893 RepID=A0ABU3PT34_9ACTN|nr:DUF881 domain-containing protein [Nocardioides zeae]MDT9592397.1 DUF881 domain-containing protein [Nocardioides zeae]